MTVGVKSLAYENVSYLDQFLANLKKDFRDAAGSTLRTDMVSGADDVELIQSTTNSPRKIAYYRMNHTLTVG